MTCEYFVENDLIVENCQNCQKFEEMHGKIFLRYLFLSKIVLIYCSMCCKPVR